MSEKTLFSPVALGGLTLRNRVAMAPMTTWAANADLTISEAEEAYYRARVGGVGLVLTGCTQVTANGIGFTDEFAASDDSFTPSLARLARAARSGGAPAILQIFHAGNKALPDLAPAGDVVSASAVPVEASLFAPAQTPREMTEDEILGIIRAFGDTTRRAIEAGFDGIELHGAHGFLIQTFFSAASNQRSDRWGGTAGNRMRFAIEVVAEVKRVIAEQAGRPFILGYRISPEESGDKGYGIEDSLALVDRLIDAGISYIHASLGDVLTNRPAADPQGPTIAERFVTHVDGRVPVIAAGGVRTPEQAQAALDLGLSLVAIGRGLVMNPGWVTLAQTGRATEIATELDPGTVKEIALPAKLWTVIEATRGWFAIKEVAATS